MMTRGEQANYIHMEPKWRLKRWSQKSEAAVIVTAPLCYPALEYVIS